MIKYDVYSKVISSCQHPFHVVDQAPELTAPDKLYAKVWLDNSNRWCCLSRLDGIFFPCILTASSPATDFQRAFASGKDALFLSDDGKPLAILEAKRTCVDVAKGRQQAKLYADLLEKKYGKAANE